MLEGFKRGSARLNGLYFLKSLKRLERNVCLQGFERVPEQAVADFALKGELRHQGGLRLPLPNHLWIVILNR